MLFLFLWQCSIVEYGAPEEAQNAIKTLNNTSLSDTDRMIFVREVILSLFFCFCFCFGLFCFCLFVWCLFSFFVFIQFISFLFIFGFDELCFMFPRTEKTEILHNLSKDQQGR